MERERKRERERILRKFHGRLRDRVRDGQTEEKNVKKVCA